jgi:hypothetical protein
MRLYDIASSWIGGIPAALCGILWFVGDRELHSKAREDLSFIFGCAAGLVLISAAGITQRVVHARQREKAERDRALGLLAGSILFSTLSAVLALLIGLLIEVALRSADNPTWSLAIGHAAWHGLGMFCLVTSPSRLDRSVNP